MKLKLISTVILCFILAFSFVACDKGDEFEKGGSTTSSTVPSTTSSTKKTSITHQDKEDPSGEKYGPVIPLK